MRKNGGSKLGGERNICLDETRIGHTIRSFFDGSDLAAKAPVASKMCKPKGGVASLLA